MEKPIGKDLLNQIRENENNKTLIAEIRNLMAKGCALESVLEQNIDISIKVTRQARDMCKTLKKHGYNLDRNNINMLEKQYFSIFNIIKEKNLQHKSKEEVFEYIRKDKTNKMLISKIKALVVKGNSLDDILEHNLDISLGVARQARQVAKLLAPYGTNATEYRANASEKEYFAIFGIDYTYAENHKWTESRLQVVTERTFSEFVKEKYAKILLNQDESNKYSNIRKETNWDVNDDALVQKYDYLVQRYFDYVFSRKSNEIIDLDKYCFAQLYELVGRHVGYLNDISFKDRLKSGEKDLSVSEYINTRLEGYKSTRYYKNIGPKLWDEKQVQENLAVKAFAEDINEKLEENGDTSKIIKELTDSQWWRTTSNVSRYARRKGIINPELYDRYGVSVKRARSKFSAKRLVLNYDTSQELVK